MPGERADGHDFAADAVGSGAVALVVERPLELDVPQVVVPSARAADGTGRATAFFGEPTAELEVAGVTGTSGKTTTAFLLFAILAAAGRRPGLLGTIEARIGGERRAVVRTTPEAIDLQRLFREMLDVGDRSCAMEASSHASELHRLDGVRFSALVFTNLSQDHLDFHGDLESYFAGEAAALRRGEPARRRERRRRVRPATRGRAARRAHVRVRRRRRGRPGGARRLGSEAARAVQRRERARARSPPGGCSGSRTTRSGAGSSRSAACPDGSRRSTRGSRSA